MTYLAVIQPQLAMLQAQDPAPLTERQARQLSLFSASLNDPDEIEQSTRVDAAKELILMNLPPATESLATALTSGRPSVILAVLEAMDEQPQPVEGLLDAAIEALKTAPSEVLNRLASVLTDYGDSAQRRVAAIALDQELPATQRLGAIQALGRFRSRESAERLIEVLQAPAADDTQLQTAACAALTSLTGLNYGENIDRWLRWWMQARHQTPEQWLKEMVATLEGRIVTLNQQNASLQSQLDAARARLIQAYEDMFPSLEQAARLAILPALLDDQEPSVRAFAVERIQRLLRDTSTIPTGLQDKLAQRLSDEVPAIRRQAAELLDSLGYEPIAELVAQAIVEERDPVVTSTYVKILAARTSPNALDPLTALLADPAHRNEAADALWTLLTSDHSSPEAIDTVREALRPVLGARDNATLVRLMAYAGAEPDRTPLEALLDGDDADLRRAVGEGFARCGYQQPLLDRAGDESIYPFALQSLEPSAGDFNGFRTIARLRPPAGHLAQWEQTISRVAARLPRDSVLQVDDLLRELNYASPRLRSNLLGRVATLPTEQLSDPDRRAVIQRWTPLLLDLGEWHRAFEVLDTLPEVAPASPLGRLKFRAALLTGRYDVAVQIDGAPQSWIGVLAEVAPDHQQAAMQLRDEIARRFNGQLTGDVKTAFDAATSRIPPSPPAPSADGNPGAAGR